MKTTLMIILALIMLGCGEDDMATIGIETESELNTTSVIDEEDGTKEYDTTRITASSKNSLSSFMIIGDVLFATGWNTSGELGLGDNTDRNVFTDTGITGVKVISSATNSTMIIKADGTLWATGTNFSGQLGLSDNTDRNIFINTGITDVKSISRGNIHSMIVKSNGTLWATGENSAGQLGLGDNTNRNVFTDTGITDVTDVSCGNAHSMIIKADGTLWSTGENFNGQLGLGDNTDRNIFTDTGKAKVDLVSSGVAFTMIKSDGGLWATGKNNDGQLGLGDNLDKNSFNNVGISDIIAVACGTGHSIIIKSDDTLWSTGLNNYGQLGLGDILPRNVFTDTGETNIKAVTCGTSHSMIIQSDDSLFSAGFNQYGQLGLGDVSPRNVFTDTNKTADTYVFNNWTYHYENDIVKTGGYIKLVTLIGTATPAIFVNFTDIGVTNSLKPFDGQNITPAISTSPMTYKITGTEEFNAFTLAKVLATSITYKFRLSDTTLIKEETIAIDCKRDENGTLALYPTTVIYYADQQMPIGSTVEITLTHSDDIELGDFILNNTIDAGFTNLAFTHGIKDYNDYTPDAWGNIPEAVKAIVTTFNVTMDFPLTNYDYAVSFNESISGKNVTIDASDSNGAIADGETIFGSLTRRVRVTNVSSNSVVKDGDLNKMASLKLSVQEIV